MDLNDLIEKVEDWMGQEGSHEAAEKMVEIIKEEVKPKSIQQLCNIIGAMDDEQFFAYWEKAVDSIEKEKLNQIIETAEGHNSRFKYIKKQDRYQLVYVCPQNGQEYVIDCPTTPNTFNYYCENCGKWICEKNLYKEE